MYYLKNFNKIRLTRWFSLLFLAMIPLFVPYQFNRKQPADTTPHHLTATVPTSQHLPDGFSSTPITPQIDARIRGISYTENCPVPLSRLCYLTVLHVGFDGQTHQGELIVHEQIAQAVLEIFYKLYLIKYPIEKIRLIDDYHANDEASMTDNNTSAFCCRTIAGTDVLSVHSYGLAIDINPLYNPYVNGEQIAPATSAYNRKSGVVFSPYFMTADDDCVRLFQSYGFIWGGSWDGVKDYQHFEYNKRTTVK